ncbi:MAG TPA: hypothetical protein VLI90_01630 [Tepidisphaeraceae bacterium]|nr:hypothetical protein [Tepidisphaeraceae bacterium]
MTTQWLLGWSNLIFILPFGLGLLYLGIYTLSGWTFGDADADAGVDHEVDASVDADGHLSCEHDADADLSHDVDADADADADTDAHVDADSDADTDADGHDAESSDSSQSSGSTILAILSWLGVGRVPVSIILMVMLMSWGVIGFAANRTLLDHPVSQAALLAMAVAFTGSILITKFVTLTVARYLPTNETYARRRHQLLGCVGEALYNIDGTFGMACGRDAVGEQFQVPCRVAEGRAMIAKGTKVQLVGYTASNQMFYVVPADAADRMATQSTERGSL